MVAGDEKIVIGKILRPHGVKGYARVLPVTDNAGRFHFVKNAWLRDEDNELFQVEIVDVKILQKAVLLKIKDIDSRNQVENIRNAEIVINRKDCLPLQKGAYYIFDLIGAKVLTTSGKEVGTLSNVINYPASDIFVVQKDEQEILIPAVAQFIKKVDIEASTITIEPIEGLIP
ncbi:MAG: ribosome maturation factor RimM [bacterium]